MKFFFIFVCTFLTCAIANAQLTIYGSLNQQGSSATCVERTIYTGATIPNNLNDGIKSMTLKKGYTATLATNMDGTGEGFNYISSVSDLSVNLANVLQNRVSFIRVLPIIDVKKKGAGSGNNDLVTAMNAGWLYDWGPNDVSTPTREYVPMAWGRGGASDANVDLVIAKTGVTSLLAFNEPDNAGQANIPAAEAAGLYRNLLRSGYRMGSPACTESQYRVWLQTFTDYANQDTQRIDFVAVHWYDWGNWLSTSNASPDVNALFTRFKNYVAAAHTLYGKPLWITEFNCNPNRSVATHEAFMALALPWLETDPRVERYAYFFPTAAPAANGTVLTPLGQIYRNHVSTSAYPQNIFDKRAGGSTVSVTENYDAFFSVYPSVTTQNTIETIFSKVSENAQIKIFNTNGQLLNAYNLQVGTNSKTIDIAKFTEGVYFLTLQDKGAIQSRKFIKQ